MANSDSTTLPQVTRSADDCQQHRTVHAPNAVSVVVGGEMLAITLGAALTPRATGSERRWASSSGLKK
jgi:hypothetical protein